jgi:cytochrome c peroxidase
MLVFCGCNKDSDGEVNSGPSALDTELVGLIDLNSNGAGTAYFRLPASTDFSNIPQDPNNPLTAAKVELGKLLFHETGTARNPRLFTSSNEYSCASCHHAAAGFQAGMAQGIGEGGMGFGFIGEGRTISHGYFDNPIWKDSVDVQPIRTPTALNVAYQANMLWNGQFGATGVNVGTENAWTAGTPKAFNHLGFEGIETQAIAGQTVHRQLIDYGFCEDYSDYMGLFKAAFGSVPESIDEMRINSGLAIAAYERTLLATEAPFQKWLKGSLNVLSDSEKLGAVVFFGKGNCVSCHTGPALNSMEFHAYGMKDLHEIASAHNANPNNVENKGRGGFTGHPDDMYKFKVPQLYNLREVGFLGHGASFNTVFDVVRYKNEGVAQNQVVPTGQLADDFQPLLLSEAEVNDLVNFLENSLFDPHLDRYAPEALPSGMCFPNADAQSMVDTGCSE